MDEANLADGFARCSAAAQSRDAKLKRCLSVERCSAGLATAGTAPPSSGGRSCTCALTMVPPGATICISTRSRAGSGEAGVVPLGEDCAAAGDRCSALLRGVSPAGSADAGTLLLAGAAGSVAGGEAAVPGAEACEDEDALRPAGSCEGSLGGLCPEASVVGEDEAVAGAVDAAVCASAAPGCSIG